MINESYSGSSEDAGVKAPANDSLEVESAKEPIDDSKPSVNPADDSHESDAKPEEKKDDKDKPAEIEPKSDDKSDEKSDDKGEIPDENPDSDKKQGDAKPDAKSELNTSIPTPEAFYEANNRRMPKEVMAEVQGHLKAGREAIERADKLTNVVNDFGGEEILTGYKPVHEFIAELPPQSDQPEDWQGYYGKADGVWETLVSQNETAAVSLATQGALSIINHLPESRELLLSAMFGRDLKEGTTAKGDNSQEDIAKYQISSERVLELIRLDALGFVPTDLEDYKADFEVKKVEAKSQPTGEPLSGEPPKEQKSNFFADFEKEFEGAIPKQIEPALEKANWTGNPDLEFVIANAVENLVRKTENFKTISEHLRAGNAYKTGEKIALPIKLNEQRVKNAATLQADNLVVRLLKGLRDVQIKNAPPPTPPPTPDPDPETQKEAVVPPLSNGKKFYSSTEVRARMDKLNGGFGR